MIQEASFVMRWEGNAAPERLKRDVAPATPCREQFPHAGVFGEEQRRVHQDADVLAGAAQQMLPRLARDAAAVMTEADKLGSGGIGAAGRCLAWRVGPKVVVLATEPPGCRPPMPAVRGTAGAESPLDGLGVHAAAQREFVCRDPGAEHRGSQPFVHPGIQQPHFRTFQGRPGTFRSSGRPRMCPAARLERPPRPAAMGRMQTAVTADPMTALTAAYPAWHIWRGRDTRGRDADWYVTRDRKSTRLNSSHLGI